MAKKLTHDQERLPRRCHQAGKSLFAENSWVQVTMGQGIMPKAYHPVARNLRDDELERLLAGIRDQVAKTVATLPDHASYVADYCGLGAAAAA